MIEPNVSEDLSIQTKELRIAVRQVGALLEDLQIWMTKCDLVEPEKLEPEFRTDLSDAEIERLSLLAEECGEVIQMVCKILRHGYESRHPNGGPKNRELLETEIGHVLYAIGLMTADSIDLHERMIDFERWRKSRNVRRYLHFQVEKK